MKTYERDTRVLSHVAETLSKVELTCYADLIRKKENTEQEKTVMFAMAFRSFLITNKTPARA